LPFLIPSSIGSANRQPFGAILDLVTIIFISISLAMDCFAVSLGIGTTPFGQTHRSRFRLSFHFALFQGLMTVLGWLAGSTIATLIGQFDHWVILALLVWIGGRMIVEGFKPEKEEQIVLDPSRGMNLVSLSVATSLDAMAVGLSMAVLKINIYSSALIIGLVSGALSLLGLRIGRKLGEMFGQRMEILGGLILIIIGIKIFISHLS
jgi:manganese efflux pump family protein